MKYSKNGCWAIYDKATGTIIQTIQGTRRNAIINMSEGQWCIPVDSPYLNSSYQKIVDRKVVGSPPPEKEKSYGDLRKEAILDEWSITQQMEAMTEAAMGRPEKLELLRRHIETVKELYPKG